MPLPVALAIGTALLTILPSASPPVRPPAPPPPAAAAAAAYDSLLALFPAWRAFHAPVRVDDVPDYTAPAMARQAAELGQWQARLAALDTTGWTIAQRIDHALVQAEMAGLEFDHRTLRPWVRDPSYYVTVFLDQSDQPAREGPHVWGGIEVWAMRFPLGSADRASLLAGLRRIPPLLQQARGNLTGNARDLWIRGTATVKDQLADLATLKGRVGTDAELVAAIDAATDATRQFAAWCDAQAPYKLGPSGVGIAEYDWWLKHVQLVPYTWAEQKVLVERELGRSLTFLRLEEARNAGRPPLREVATPAEYDRRFPAAVRDYVKFLRQKDLMTIEPWHEPALMERIGRFRPPPRDFFYEVDYRDPMVMRTHGFHWFDLARLRERPHPSVIRRTPGLYNMFATRTEGLATGWEEMMLQAGMFDREPRSRELIYILLAQRGARAMGDLMMHANLWTIEQAARFASEHTPRNWLRMDGNTVWHEQQLYLQQPAYGTSYVIGKMMIEELLEARQQAEGPAFRLRGFMDALEASGLIPQSLVGWEVLGRR
ncbi:MAG: DUF885 family protein [Gemmatimonadales bacterium]|nr:DUF885 family protein [Gemmatimonadales bacterium]